MRKAEKIALFGGSFNPAGRHHRRIAQALSEIFDYVFVIPCGRRSDKPSANILDPKHRKEIVKRAFSGMNKKIRLDFYDLDKNIYTPTCYLQERYEEYFSNAKIKHVAGTDLIREGREGKSEIQTVWTFGKYIWKEFFWVVIVRPGYSFDKNDLPPKSDILEIKNLIGSGKTIRKKIVKGETIEELVLPEVASYIKKHKLYQ